LHRLRIALKPGKRSESASQSISMKAGNTGRKNKVAISSAPSTKNSASQASHTRETAGRAGCKLRSKPPTSRAVAQRRQPFQMAEPFDEGVPFEHRVRTGLRYDADGLHDSSLPSPPDVGAVAANDATAKALGEIAKFVLQKAH